ncbi:MAG: hypothetical protein DYG89_50535 [Caldilinea sp. CFX5]|nr:hypothetical protein [Caldilinea sp. CFX5]
MKTFFRQHFWPLSAMIFCPCHLPLSMAGVAWLTAGTFVGGFVSTYYSTIESVLAIAFSFYFVLAFMIWAVRGPQKVKGAACPVDAQGRPQIWGLSTRQIVITGFIGMFVIPLLVTASLFVREDLIGQFMAAARTVELNSGFIWLISITTVVMIPVMVIWLVWMWIAWNNADPDLKEDWKYEYE